MSPEQAKALYRVPDPDWPFNIEDKFDIVFINKAHMVKNTDTASHISMVFLGIFVYYYLISACILQNRVSDINGPTAFIKPKPSPLTNENLQKWGVTRKTNVYTLLNDHPAAILRISPYFITKWITGPTASDATSGYYLSLI
jgi:hypothetical protein